MDENTHPKVLQLFRKGFYVLLDYPKTQKEIENLLKNEIPEQQLRILDDIKTRSFKTLPSINKQSKLYGNRLPGLFSGVSESGKLGFDKLAMYIDEKIKQLKSPGDMENKNPKLKWLGNPEQFGYIFGELASKGYLELPTKQGEGAFSKLAELCLNYFDISVTKGKTKGNQTTIENLERTLNPETNKLSVKGKAALLLPPLAELK